MKCKNKLSQERHDEAVARHTEKKRKRLIAVIEAVAEIKETDPSTMTALRMIWWQELGQYTGAFIEQDPVLSIAQFLFDPALKAPIEGFSKKKVAEIMGRCNFRQTVAGTRGNKIKFIPCPGDFSPAPSTGGSAHKFIARGVE